MADTCASCRFFFDHGVGSGPCRRNAPTNGWPSVHKGLWCGQHEKAVADADGGWVALRKLRDTIVDRKAWCETSIGVHPGMRQHHGLLTSILHDIDVLLKGCKEPQP